MQLELVSEDAMVDEEAQGACSLLVQLDDIDMYEDEIVEEDGAGPR
jgi:hypothetical protein